MTHRGQSPGYLIAPFVALAGISLKLFQWYHSRTLWLDEEMTFLNVRDRTLSQLAGPLWLDQSAPLGWLALQRLILQSLGTGERAVRALSVVFGVATLVCAVWVGVRWMKPAGAALFVLFCSIGQWIVFYALEAKPYPADAFWALLLPALAVWATETSREPPSAPLRRSLLWWITASVGQWVSYGAVFVAPGGAVLLCAVAWRRSGWRRALTVMLQGIPWLVSFAAHYYLVMRHTRASAALTDYWASGLPPEGATLGGAVAWLAQQAAPLASHPGGTALWVSFWLAVTYGIAMSLRDRPVLALSWLLVPVSAGLFAVVRLVPLQDRLAFWMLPALYVAVALAVDDSLLRGRTWLIRRTFPALTFAGLTAILVWPLSADIVERGRSNLMLRPVDNHEFNDEAAVRLLMAQRMPGDVLVATRLGLPALWWYGDISIADPNAGREYTGDAAPVLEVMHAMPDSPACRRVEGETSLQRALAGQRRAAVYLGFDSRIPAGFQELILDNFSEFSRLEVFKFVGQNGIVAIFDLQSRPAPRSTPDAPAVWHRADAVSVLAGCVYVRVPHRW